MSDSGGSPFEGFTEAVVRHIPPTQVVDSADIVVSPVGSIGTESQMRTTSSLSCSSIMDSITGKSAREASVASTPGFSRLFRSHSRARGLAN